MQSILSPQNNICVTKYHISDSVCHHNETVIFPYSYYIITGLVTGLALWLPLVELELIIIPGHPSSPSGLLGFVLVILSVFLCSRMYVIVCSVAFLLLALVWHILRFMIYDYPVNIALVHFSCEFAHDNVYFM